MLEFIKAFTKPKIVIINIPNMLSSLKKIYSLDFLNGKILEKSALKLILVNILLFVIPFVIGEPQIIVGSIVNFFLIYIALNFRQKDLLPAIFLPAIASLSRNVLFGSLTIYLSVLMPFIWVSNALFIFAIRAFLSKSQRLSLSLFSAGFLKAAFLFSITSLLILQFKFPQQLIIAMGVMQLITASIATIAYVIFYTQRKGN